MNDYNQQIILSSYPRGIPKESDFHLKENPIPNPKDSEFLVRAIYLSVDPFLRMLMNPSDKTNSISRTEGNITDVGQVMAGGLLGEVVISRNADYPVGIIVEGILGWQTYAVTNGWVNKRHNPAGVVKCETSLGLPISAFASILGRAGLTAYFCMLRELKPRKGETVVVTAAAGAGGSLAGQIAKMCGCHVVGICGSDKKVDWITKELGFDVGINYKKNDLDRALKTACPKGIDVHYDNVGGSIMESIAALHNHDCRYRLVGIISEYNTLPKGKTFWSWPYQKPMFVVHDYTKDYNIGVREIASWIKSGHVKYREDIVEGIANTPAAFIDMLQGGNIGKKLVKVSREPKIRF